MSLQEKFDYTLAELLPERGVALLAISGGADSICMAELFSRSSLKPDFAVAHCNFHLRGAESNGDEDFVEKWCLDHSVRYFKTDFDTMSVVSERGVSMEMAARSLRYDWFASLCKEHGFSAVVVAHNANDNAETMILNLLRGTGLKGITGMKPDGSVPGTPEVRLIRPLLGFQRSEILSFLSSENIPHREDSSNSNPIIRRNRLRTEVFPIFEKINPSCLRTLNTEAAIFSQVALIVDDYFIESREKVLLPVRPGEALRIDSKALMSQKHAEYLLYRLLEPYSFPSETAAAVLETLSSSTSSGKKFKAPGYVLVTAPDSMSIVVGGELWPQDSGEIMVSGPGEYSLDGVRFSILEATREDLNTLVQPKGILVVDADALPFPFVARHWKRGDWMRPFGLRARKKLSDIFADHHFSILEKSSAVVLVWGEGSRPDTDGAHVAALAGLRIDEAVKVTEHTDKIHIVKIL